MPDHLGHHYCSKCSSNFQTEEEKKSCESKHAEPVIFHLKHCRWRYGDKYPRKIMIEFSDGEVGTYNLEFTGW